MIHPGLPQKPVYVPTAAAKKKDATESIKLDHATLLRSAGSVFRSIPWSGTREEPQAPTSKPLTHDELVSSARTMFAQTVKWSGEQFGPPTDTQSRQSVKFVLAAFKWETP